MRVLSLTQTIVYKKLTTVYEKNESN